MGVESKTISNRREWNLRPSIIFTAILHSNFFYTGAHIMHSAFPASFGMNESNFFYDAKYLFQDQHIGLVGIGSDL